MEKIGPALKIEPNIEFTSVSNEIISKLTVQDIYDMYKGEKSIVASILIQSDLTITYDKYLVNTIFIKKPLEPQ